ncbi:acyl-CoA dehydrogenase family protein [Roseobacter sp. HKCCA0434]|uniref:acyl-CoA dehydrogenase family protein n=1 Tax=Roseobacter sp. HKCCA0434 TaxID=3079297 RepID=UPI002905CAFA|nr:acyl-CoA dehydrogenase family protein [Roseobacter sp. HKCCA0434]
MTPFNAPVDDILFTMTHVAGADAATGWDAETAREVLTHFGQFAEGVIAPLNGPGDRQGARLEQGRVHMPDGFGPAFRQLAEGGWQGLTAPEAFGGMGLSPLVAACVSEIFAGANHSLQMVCNLVPGAITTLLRFGTEAQQAHWIPRLASGTALSTMCITEPAAGSDLGTIRTKATRDGDDWRLDGEKIFISGGDQDMSDDILHLVLARSGGPGIGGLSLFLCPRQSGARVTRIEEKLGLHASPTCQMVFDGARAELIGAEGQGLAAMFVLMNHARLDVALQGVGHAARAAGLARTYAGGRGQGRQADGSPAMLTHHADIRRMLDEQDALALTTRAMCHVSLVQVAHGADPALAEFLTSLCKVAGSEAGPRAADLGIQVLGGYGYLPEYGMEQIWRDARICAIYEGANGIHMRTLVTRGLRSGGADLFEALMTDLADGAPDATLLARWHDLKARATAATDATPLAHSFHEAAAALFRDCIGRRIAAVARHHPDPDRLRRLITPLAKEHAA